MAKSGTPKRATDLQNLPAAEENSPPTSEPEILSKASEALRPFLRDENQAGAAARQVVSMVRLHRGPLPPPELLGGYDDIMPGAAREIMDMAIREQAHRHAMERAERNYPYFGMAAGFATFLYCVCGAIYLAISSQPVVAGLLVGTPLIGTIGWFVNGRLQIKRAELPEAVSPQSKRPRRR